MFKKEDGDILLFAFKIWIGLCDRNVIMNKKCDIRLSMNQKNSKEYLGRKCFYCNREATNITIDDEGEMFYLCEKHLKIFRALYPKEGYKQKDDDDEIG